MFKSAVLALVVLVLLPAAARAADTLTVTNTEQLTPRLVQLTMKTSAIPRDVHVRVLLPTGYDAATTTRYPVIYLLHGSTNDASTWTNDKLLPGFVDTVANVQAIVVMPDAGVGGEYADWRNGAFRWETFHIKQLVPYIDAHYRTLADRAHRALTGASMGGLGTMRYATRHPDLFGVAAPMSGAVSLNSPVGQAGVVLNEQTEKVASNSIFGSKVSDEVLLRGNSPVDLALNLGGVKTLISTYTGLPGGQDNGPPDPTELGVHEMSQELDAELRLLGLPHEFKVLGDGGHTYPDFLRQAQLHFPQLMDAFAHPEPAPADITYASIDDTFSAYDWTVTMNRSVREFATLENASTRAFALSGSGSATVTTPPRYRPKRAYDVTMTPAAAGQPGAALPELACTPAVSVCLPDGTPPPNATQAAITPGTPVTSSVVADRDGRLTLTVPLGRSNRSQEYRAGAGTNADTLIYRTTVAIAATACTSRRSVRYTLPAGATGVRVIVGGKRAKLVRSGRRVTVSFAGTAARSVRVVITARVRGHRYARHSTVHPCTRSAR